MNYEFLNTLLSNLVCSLGVQDTEKGFSLSLDYNSYNLLISDIIDCIYKATGDNPPKSIEIVTINTQYGAVSITMLETLKPTIKIELN